MLKMVEICWKDMDCPPELAELARLGLGLRLETDDPDREDGIAASSASSSRSASEGAA